MKEANPQPLPPPPETPSTAVKTRWPFYVATGLILLPGVFALTGNSSAAAAGALLMAPLGALISGIVLGIQVGQTTGMRFLLSGVFAAVCLIAAEGVAIGGCALNNPKFHFQ